MTAANALILEGYLAVAVPLWVQRLRGHPYDRLAARSAELADAVASGGDLALYRGSRPGQSAKAMAEVAEAVAVGLLLAPPGQAVTVAGRSWRLDDPWVGGRR